MKSLSESTQGELEEWEVEVIYAYLGKFYDGVDLPREGFLPQCGHSQRSTLHTAVFPMYDRECVLSKDPVLTLVDTAYTGSVRVSRFGPDRFKANDHLHEGFSFQSQSSKGLSFLVKMGYMIREEEHETLVGDKGYLALLKSFQYPEKKVYRFTTLDPLSLDQLVGVGLADEDRHPHYFAAKRRYYRDWDEPIDREVKRLRYEEGDDEEDAPFEDLLDLHD